MDMVFFTGVVPEHEMKEERPVEYARLVAQGRLQQLGGVGAEARGPAVRPDNRNSAAWCSA